MMKHLSWIVAAFVATSAPAGADGPMTGCFERVYSDAHLAGQPAQIVKRLLLDIYQPEGGAKVAEMLVTTANQGHVAITGHGGQNFRQFLICWSQGERDVCAVECDAGQMEITKQDDKGLTFRTETLWVGGTQDCGGAVNIIEKPGKSVSYRLNRVSLAICDGAF